MCIRDRYYDAENGTFTTEDSDLGTTENPLTRNRYDYTTNNPLNYSDPTGHSLWSRIKSTAKKAAKAVKSVGKKIVNTAKKVVKTVVNTAKKAAKTIVNVVKGAAKTVKNAVTHPKKTYQSVRSSVTNSYRKVVSRGSSFVRSVSNGVQKIGKTYTSFKSYVSERTSEIRSEVVRHMCTTTNRITDQLGKVNWKNVAIGVTAMVVSGVVVAATGGLATGAVLAALPAMGGLGTAMVSGAVAGAIGGASYGAISSGLSGNSLKQVAKDTLTGGLTGAISGGILGGLTYGAGKALSAVKDLVKGKSSSTKPGHITEMATKKLDYTSENEAPLLTQTDQSSASKVTARNNSASISDNNIESVAAGNNTTKSTTASKQGNNVKTATTNTAENNAEATSGYYKDNNGRWHRKNGQFASNEEVGIPSKKTSASHNHGNSLEDTRTNYGYALVDKDTNEILKFGETLNPEKRYSQKYLNENNAVMKVIESGSKRDIHMWQYDMNKYYESKYGEFPPLLKSKGW